MSDPVEHLKALEASLAGLRESLNEAPDLSRARVDSRGISEPNHSAWVRSLVAKTLALPDVEFLALANKLINRYAQVMDSLAPPGVPPASTIRKDSTDEHPPLGRP